MTSPRAKLSHQSVAYSETLKVISMTTFRQEKDRLSMGVDEPGKTKNIDGQSCGTSECNPNEQAPPPAIQQTWRLVHDAYQRGYSQGRTEGLAQGPTHPAVQQSVERMFGDWHGAEAARQQSTQRFNNWYRKERAA